MCAIQASPQRDSTAKTYYASTDFILNQKVLPLLLSACKNRQGSSAICYLSLEGRKENLEFRSAVICHLYGLPLGLIL